MAVAVRGKSVGKRKTAARDESTGESDADIGVPITTARAIMNGTSTSQGAASLGSAATERGSRSMNSNGKNKKSQKNRSDFHKPHALFDAAHSSSKRRVRSVVIVTIIVLVYLLSALRLPLFVHHLSLLQM